MWKETGKGRRWWKAHELFADRRCSQAALNFLASTEVGKTVPAADEDARSEASEWELRERAEREEERRAEAETLGRGMEREEHPLFLPTPPSWHWRERSRVFCCFCFSFVHFSGRRAQGELALCRPARFAARKRIVNSPLVMIYIGRIRVTIKQKKNLPHCRRDSLYSVQRTRRRPRAHGDVHGVRFKSGVRAEAAHCQPPLAGRPSMCQVNESRQVNYKGGLWEKRRATVTGLSAVCRSRGRAWEGDRLLHVPSALLLLTLLVPFPPRPELPLWRRALRLPQPGLGPVLLTPVVGGVLSK